MATANYILEAVSWAAIFGLPAYLLGLAWKSRREGSRN